MLIDIWGCYHNMLQYSHYVNRFLCHHTFQTDLSDTFFRLESRDLATPHDVGLFQVTGETDRIDTNYHNYNNRVAEPFAEILIKGLSLSHVDLPAEDEGVNQKSIAITGIVNSGNPESIVDDKGGVEVTGADEIVIGNLIHN